MRTKGKREKELYVPGRIWITVTKLGTTSCYWGSLVHCGQNSSTSQCCQGEALLILLQHGVEDICVFSLSLEILFLY
jgi:hypothetical protein